MLIANMSLCLLTFVAICSLLTTWLIGAAVRERVNAEDAGNAMNDIVAQVGRVDALVGEISAASQEQSKGIGQVGDAVAQLDQVTQQNAALVEESAAAAESLKVQAARLSVSVPQRHLDARVVSISALNLFHVTTEPRHRAPRRACCCFSTRIGS